MTNCTHCGTKIIFDTAIKTETDKFIPLNEDKTPRDCQGKYQNGNNKPKEEPHPK